MADLASLLPELFAAGDAGDLDAFERYLQDDVVVHAPVGLSTEGLEAERESWRKAKAAMPDLRHQFVDVVVGEHVVAARTVVTGTMTGSYGGLSSQGRSFRVDQAVFAHTRDGKISEMWEMVDTADLEAQLAGSSAGQPLTV